MGWEGWEVAVEVGVGWAKGRAEMGWGVGMAREAWVGGLGWGVGKAPAVVEGSEAGTGATA